MPHELTENFLKIVFLKCCLLLFYWTIMNHFSIRLWCRMKSGFYTPISNDQLSGWTEKKLQSTSQSQNLHPKMVMVTVWWSAASLIHYNFLNPGETITSEKYAQKINEIHQNCNACSQYWSTERAQLPNSFPQQYLTMHCTTSTSNVERFGLKSFALSTIFIWPLAHRLPLFQASQQLFAEEMLPQ